MWSPLGRGTGYMCHETCLVSCPLIVARLTLAESPRWQAVAALEAVLSMNITTSAGVYLGGF